eukprot:4187018-Pyramimonas_sp.AAC.1
MRLRQIPRPKRSHVDFCSSAEVALAAGQPHCRPCMPARTTASCCRDACCCQRMDKLTLHGGLAVPSHHGMFVGRGSWDLVAAYGLATPCVSTAS